VWIAVEVVMVSMTSNGFPTHSPCSFSIGEIIFFVVLISTEIVEISIVTSSSASVLFYRGYGKELSVKRSTPEYIEGGKLPGVLYW